MTDAEIITELRSFYRLKGWSVLREAADRLEHLDSALINIGMMDCYTREGEEPVHVLMMRLANEARLPEEK